METASPGAAAFDETTNAWTILTSKPSSPGGSTAEVAAAAAAVPRDRLVDYHAAGTNSARANNFYLPTPEVLKDWLRFAGFGGDPHQHNGGMGGDIGREQQGQKDGEAGSSGVNVTEPGVPWGASVRAFAVGRKPTEGYVDFQRGGFSRPHLC